MIRRPISRFPTLALLIAMTAACSQVPTSPPAMRPDGAAAGRSTQAQAFRSAVNLSDVKKTVGNVAEKAGEIAQGAANVAEKAGGVVQGASSVAGGVMREAGDAVERFGSGVAAALSSSGGRLGAIVGGALLAPFGLLPAILGASQGALLGHEGEQHRQKPSESASASDSQAKPADTQPDAATQDSADEAESPSSD